MCLRKLFLGNFLFPGRNNNEMIKLILQTKGKFNNRILRRGEFVYKYFDNNYNFLSCEIDPISKQVFIIFFLSYILFRNM